MPIILSIFGLFMIFLYFFALIASFLFNDIQTGKIIGEFVNFNNIFYSMMTLLKMISSDEWTSIMYDTSQIYILSPIFFIIFLLITKYLILNILTLVILQELNDYYINPNNPFNFYQDNILMIKDTWALYCDNQNKESISKNKIINFLKMIGPPLGIYFNASFIEVGKKLINLNLQINENDEIHFKIVLFSILKSYYEDKNLFNSDDLNSQQELNIKENIFINKVRKIVKYKKFIPFNPIYSYLNHLIVFTAWKNFSQKCKEGFDFERNDESLEEKEDSIFSLNNTNLKSLNTLNQKKGIKKTTYKKKSLIDLIDESQISFKKNNACKNFSQKCKEGFDFERNDESLEEKEDSIFSLNITNLKSLNTLNQKKKIKKTTFKKQSYESQLSFKKNNESLTYSKEINYKNKENRKDSLFILDDLKVEENLDPRFINN